MPEMRPVTRLRRPPLQRRTPLALAGGGALLPPDLRPFTPAVLALAAKYEYDSAHAANVAALAARCFESLPRIHGLGPEWLPLLQHAALLHDIGYFVHSRRHHRHSAYLIQQDALLADYPQPWRDMLALVARNHRKRVRGAPRAWGSAAGQAGLGLSALLRIADGCDYGHDGAANLAGVRLGRGKVQIRLAGARLDGLARILRRKSRLFSRTYGISVSFVVQA